jgi:hypothetical protein
MKVGFIGAGNVTRTIGRHLIAAGHTIVVSNSRGPETLTDFVANLGPGGIAGTKQQAAECEVVILATKWVNVDTALKGVDWRARILIDATNAHMDANPAEIAREIGVNDSTVYSWLLGQARPAEPQRIAVFLDSLPRENGSGIAPTGYQYREYKNWRGIPKPRRCPFCKQAKGEILKSRGGFLGVRPNCEARGPKRESHDEALLAWNGKGG